MIGDVAFSMFDARRALRAAAPKEARWAARVAGLSWWQVDAKGNVVDPDGALDALPFGPDLAGTNVLDASGCPHDDARAVLSGEVPEARCRYVMRGRTWVAVVQRAWVNDDKGVIVATWPEGGADGADCGRSGG